MKTRSLSVLVANTMFSPTILAYFWITVDFVIPGLVLYAIFSIVEGSSFPRPAIDRCRRIFFYPKNQLLDDPAGLALHDTRCAWRARASRKSLGLKMTLISMPTLTTIRRIGTTHRERTAPSFTIP